MILAREKLAMGFEGEHETQPIGDYEQDGQAHTQRMREGCTWRVIGCREQRRNEHCDRCKKEHPGLQSGGIAIVLLNMVLEPAEQKR